MVLILERKGGGVLKMGREGFWPPDFPSSSL